jgi:diguanylate cyclase (GGDEF)-like protein
LPQDRHSPALSADAQSREDSSIVEHLFYALPFPFVLLDDAGMVVQYNTQAESLFGLELSDRHHGTVLSLLTIARTTEDGLEPWSSWEAFHSELLSGDRIPCYLRSRDGHILLGSLVGAPLVHHGAAYTLLGLVGDRTSELLESHLPAWAVTDPVTGLPNRVFWDQHRAAWNGQPGTLLFLDVDDLKTVNDLYGHETGDRLLATIGHTLRTVRLRDGVLVRYGGDEFVGWCAGSYVDEAAEYAQAVNTRLQEGPWVDALPIIPHVSYGMAQYAAGHLEEALRQADDAMYAQKGTLLPSQRGGRLIISRHRRTDLETVETSVTQPGQFAHQFGVEFDPALRRLYTRAVEEAQTFVAFADPEPGTAVVEVGAGTGRLAFDGGLANRVGPEGVLLLTDPSSMQLQQARQRAQATPWVRFLVAPAETLPLASGGADWALGAWFLHLCHPVTTLHELTRVLRPGGRLALDVIVDWSWPPAWLDILWPLRQALTDAGLPFRAPGHRSGEIAALCADLGLQVERTVRESGQLAFSDWRTAWRFLEQGGHLSVMMQGLTPAVRDPVREEVSTQMAAVFAQARPQDLVVPGQTEYLVIRKP